MKREDVLWTLAGLGFVHGYLTSDVFSAMFGMGLVAYILHHDSSFSPSVEASVEVPGEVEEGEEFRIGLQLKNTGGPVGVEVFNETPPEVESRPVWLFLGRGESRVVDYPARASMKGIYRVSTVLRLYDPSGMYFEEIRLGEGELRVYPSVDSIREAAREEANIRIAQRMKRGITSGIDSMEVHGLREYYPGDDLRKIDWKASARLGELIVREFLRETESPVYIVLDATRGMRRRVKRARIDYATSLVLYLATLLVMKNRRVGLVVYSEDGFRLVPPSAGKEQVNRIRNALEFRPAGGRPGFRVRLGELSPRGRRFLSRIFPRRRAGLAEALLGIKEPAHLLLVTDLMSDTSRLYRLISMLKKKHTIAILSPNPVLFHAGPLDEETLKILYERYLEREELIRKFNSLVPTVDLGPEDYAREVVRELG
ncbi:hypothetical protein APY94_02095 [Thermococcus celericrescens]|uniref:DUF58 domain-containing protein n=1 Tax=Thermococcus celericrescens TaxID=227598 RepID=A0A100XZ69_9EURY|nr:DUF58 domain-containing protein [Thermococcus celericrescens]KUH34447.1 hypothetical protein APY94_02095 [Thermococcus celericrescens]